MALTIARVSGADSTFGNKRIKTRTITFDDSYPTGGESLTAADLGLRTLDAVIPHGAFRKTADSTDAIAVSYNHTTAKLVAYRQKDPAAAGGADIALPEVGNTTDLSGYSGRVTAIGSGMAG